MSFNHDIFISYATVDDQERLEGVADSRWVSALRRTLERRVNEFLGRRDETRIFMDVGGIEGNQPITPQIQESVQRSATLVVFLSRGYLHSDRCRQEREIFLGGPGGTEQVRGRIFLVLVDETPRDQWPLEFRELPGYTFFEQDPRTRVIRRFADPRPNAEERSYWDVINKLRTELARTIESLRSVTPTVRSAFGGAASGGTGSAVTLTPPQTAVPALVSLPQSPILAASPAATEPAPEPRAVLLAETAQDRDLLKERESVAAYLRDNGYTVLPVRYYPRAPDGFAQAIDRDLATSRVFVQILGAVGSFRTDDLPEGYEGLQLSRAQVTGKPMIRWRNKTLNLAAVEDEAHRRFLEGPDVRATELEELKAWIAQEFRRTEIRQQLSAPDGDRFVLVNTSPDDLPLADQFAEQMAHAKLGYDVYSEDRPLDEVMSAESFDGIVVVYGRCRPEWIQDRCRALRRLAMARKEQAPACAVYIGPPSPKEPLRCRFSRLHVLENLTEAALALFVDEVQRRPTA